MLFIIACAPLLLFPAAFASNPVKITDLPFKPSHARELNKLVWSDNGNASAEMLYCVGDSSVRELVFLCVDCSEKSVSDLSSLLADAKDISRATGFPVGLVHPFPLFDANSLAVIRSWCDFRPSNSRTFVHDGNGMAPPSPAKRSLTTDLQFSLRLPPLKFTT